MQVTEIKEYGDLRVVQITESTNHNLTVYECGDILSKLEVFTDRLKASGRILEFGTKTVKGEGDINKWLIKYRGKLGK